MHVPVPVPVSEEEEEEGRRRTERSEGGGGGGKGAGRKGEREGRIPVRASEGRWMRESEGTKALATSWPLKPIWVNAVTPVSANGHWSSRYPQACMGPGHRL